MGPSARRVVAGKTRNAVAHYVLAAEQLRAGDYVGAESELARVPQRNLDKYLSPILVAWVQMGQGRIVDALDTVDAIEENRGFDVVRLLHVGMLNEQAEKPAAAENGFARAMEISVHTLRNWEQGRRKPEGSAVALLRIAARHPKIIRENLETAA